MVRIWSLKRLQEQKNIRTVLLEVAGIEVKCVLCDECAWVRTHQVA